MQGWDWHERDGPDRLENLRLARHPQAPTEATIYPGTCLLENTAVSIGRGTDTPFEILASVCRGSRNGNRRSSNSRHPACDSSRRFLPKDDPRLGARDCDGLDAVDQSRCARHVPAGVELAATLKFHPGKFTLDRKSCSCSRDKAERLKRGETGSQVNDSLRDEVSEFRKIRWHLLY